MTLTGGCGWVQEDLIELKNIFIPDPKAEIDMSCILGNERKISHVISSENFFKVSCLLRLLLYCVGWFVRDIFTLASRSFNCSDLNFVATSKFAC